MGTLTFALVLILAGVLLMIYQLVPGFDLLWILRFSPAILIVLGIELLFYSSKPDARVRFDWLSMLGCAFILCIVGTAAVLPTVWHLWGPEREHAASRIESEKVAGIYNALTGDPALKSRIANANVNVWISHTASDSYALQAGDECALHLSFTAEYDSDEAFAADCQAVMQAADANGLGLRPTTSARVMICRRGRGIPRLQRRLPGGADRCPVGPARADQRTAMTITASPVKQTGMITSAVSCGMRFPTSTPTGTTASIPMRNT
mgnify:CR=1 FL=1